MSTIIFVLGVYFHYKIIISRQIYQVRISNKEECFESDIFGKLYSYIYKKVEDGEGSDEEPIETEIETVIESIKIQRRKNENMKFITNG